LSRGCRSAAQHVADDDLERFRSWPTALDDFRNWLIRQVA
jgi:hypothetical protein